MSYGETDTIDWGDIRKLDEWMDAFTSAPYRDQPLALSWSRIAKIGEEYGEVVAAYIGATGQNPRKGFTHNRAQVLEELCDVIITAVCAIQHFTKDDWETKTLIMSRLGAVAKRMRESEQ